MAIEFVSVAAFIGGAVLSMFATSRADAKGLLSQQEILKRGERVEGRITKVWRPPLLGSFPRVYFEFQPPGSERMIQGCHIDRRPLAGYISSLPATGTSVAVCYLPENPAHAVIAKLVSRWVR
jgi:predicted membrane-bound mannosyltransferase